MELCSNGPKQCYSKAQAEHVARAVMRNRKRKIRIYLCDNCFYYHLTHEKKERKGPRRKGLLRDRHYK